MFFQRFKKKAEAARAKVFAKQEPVGHEFVRWVEFGKCPDCGATDRWQEGPSGGSCINFRCSGCGSKFNVGIPPLNLIQRIG